MAGIVDRDPDAEYLNVRVVGGEQPGATFSQKVGPLKIPGKVVGEDIRKLTLKDYKLQKVHVLLKVKDRKATCEINPTTAQLVIKGLKEEREPKKKGADKVPALHNGSLALTDLFKIAAEVRFNSRSRTLRGTVKEVLGTCLSVGCFVDGKSPKEVIAAVNGGRAAVAELFDMGAEQDSLPSFLDE
ncbi:large subunit ribosomal protein L12e [Pancytospora philotis]|nr:large subunit ribosomal protein L12e [Pancytospora philotis]